MTGMSDSNKRTRRRFLKATGGIATVVALAGCSGSSGESNNTNNQENPNSNGGNGNGNNSGENGNNGDSGGGQQTQQNIEADTSKKLQLTSGSVTTFDPVAATDAVSGYIIHQMFDALMSYPNGEADPVKGLAKEFELSDDKTTYTFKLKDAKFHNGKAVTAQDFIYSWERLAASKNSNRAYFVLDSLGVKHETMTQNGEEMYKPGSLALKASDKKTLEITLSEPFHAALEVLAYNTFAVIPEGILGDIEGYDGEMSYEKFTSTAPVGSGPFKLKEYQSGTQVEITRFDDYFGGKASIAGVHWQIMDKSTASYQYAIAKNVDSFDIPTSQYDQSKIDIKRGPDNLGRKFGTYGPLKNGETVQYISVPMIITYYLGFNMEKVPKPIRQAFAYTVNQKQVIENTFKGGGSPAYHLTPPSIYPGGAKAYEKHAKQAYPYGYNQIQLDKARKVMKDAGYGPDKRYTVTWTQFQDAAWLSLAKLLRDQLSSAYIDMKIQQAPFSTLLEREHSGKVEVYTLDWIADWPAPDNFLQLLNPPQTDTSKPASLTGTNWSSKTGDAAKQAKQAYQRVLDNQAPTKKAKQTRNQAYIEIEEANWEDVSILPLYNSLGERFTYDWADIPSFGGMGRERQKLDDVKIAKQRG